MDPNSAASGSGRMNKRAVTAGRSEAAARVGMRADGESRRQRRSSAARSRLGGVDFHGCTVVYLAEADDLQRQNEKTLLTSDPSWSSRSSVLRTN